jgi:Peptidase family C54
MTNCRGSGTSWCCGFEFEFHFIGYFLDRLLFRILVPIVLFSDEILSRCGSPFALFSNCRYGPGTACYVLRDLVEMHGKTDNRMFRVHVAAGGTVYRDAIEDTMAREAKAGLEKEEQKRAKQLPALSHPLDLAWEEVSSPLANVDAPWDTALLLLIPLRLGLKNFNSEYVEALVHTFSMPQSVGVLGGRPRGARWFYGAQHSKILGLDPHTVQAAPKRRTTRVNGRTMSSVIELSDEYLRSVHTTYPEVFSMLKLDPSIALGFYCRDRIDLEGVFASLRSWKAQNPDRPELFAVADKAPDYTGSTSAMDSILDALDDEDGDDAKNESDDEDEFVML